MKYNINTRISLLIKILFITGVLITILPQSPEACISVCLDKNGEVIFGNNLDWIIVDGLVVINKRNVLKRGIWYNDPAEWTSKYASITTNQEGREFPSRGMNEAGLVIGEMTLNETVYPDPDFRPVLIPLQWIQYLLDNCATIQDVLETDNQVRIHKDSYPSHFFVCDSTGDCVTMEWLHGELVAHAYEEVPVKVIDNIISVSKFRMY